MAVQLFTKLETAQRLKVSTRQIEVWVKDGILPVHRFGRRCVRFNAKDVEKFASKFRGA